MSLEEVLQEYFRWFGDKLDSFSQIRDNELRIIACILLADCIAKGVYPHKPARERFLGLLENFSQDLNWSRVSLYYLAEDNRYSRFKEETAIDGYVSEGLKWKEDNARIHYCEVDPMISVLEKENPGFPEAFLDLCRQYRYSEVFYKKYRYCLVYESKVLSEFVSDSAGGDRPYYASLMARKAESSYKKRLVFPAGYIMENLRAINMNVRDFMAGQNLNPYQRYE